MTTDRTSETPVFHRINWQHFKRISEIPNIAINVAAQAILWPTLAISLVKHQWGSGLWAMFTCGMVLVLVTIVFQVQSLIAEKRTSGKMSLLARLTLGAAVLSLVGNAVIIGFMVGVHLPWQPRDSVLCAIALACLGATYLIGRNFPMLAQLPGRKRFLVELGFSTRVVVQAVSAIIALGLTVSPVPKLPLVGLTFIGFTFLASFFLQDKTAANPEVKAATRANKYLYFLNFCSVILLWIAFVRATVL